MKNIKRMLRIHRIFMAQEFKRMMEYKGDFIDEEEHDIYYSIYDSDFNLLYETDTLGVVFEKGNDYYAVVDVKWGHVKNYVCLRYCIKITT